MRDRGLFVQSGDFREACRRFDAGGPETYLDQKRSVAFVRAMAPEREIVVVAVAGVAYDEEIEPGLRVIGLPTRGFYHDSIGRDLLERVSPTLLVPRTPHAGLLAAAAERGVPTYPTLADIFLPARLPDLATRAGLRRLRSNRRLTRLLAAPNIPGVANHSLTASRTLHAVLGLPERSVTPWEWTRGRPDPAPKAAPSGPISLFYAGALSPAKGVGDLIRAAGRLARSGCDLRLRIAGDGPDRAAFEALAEAESLGDRATLLGRVPHEVVGDEMRAADVVVVPSRRDYPEGLPNTVYEALIARTPLVVSDHPALASRLTHERDALIARDADPADLAAQIRRYIEEPALYERVSRASEAAYRGLFVGATWYTLIEAFLADPSDASGWVAAHSLAALNAREA